MWIVNYIMQLNIVMWIVAAGTSVFAIIVGKHMEEKGYSEEKIEEVVNSISYTGILALVTIFMIQLLLRQLPVSLPTP